MLALADRPAAAERTLSYGALADYERCGYRFLSERVLGLGGGDGIGVAGNGAGGGGLGFGRAVHGLLERSARDGWRPVAAEEAEAALRSEGFGEAEATRAAGLVAAWTDSPLLEELRSAQAVFRPEVPFRIGFGGETVIRGTIDLIAERPGGPPLFVDYKTDRIDAGADPELTAAYEIQRLLYAFAVAEATGADEVESAYCFLGAADRPIRRRHDREAIAAGRAAVEERVSRIRSGDFSPTPDPGPSLCHDCPARARLCPYPTELTMGRAE